MACNKRPPTEKSCEDVRQHARGQQRTRRHKLITCASVFDGQLTSNVLESTGMDCVRVTEAEIATQSWRLIALNEKSKRSFLTNPQWFPKKLNRVEDVDHE